MVELLCPDAPCIYLYIHLGSFGFGANADQYSMEHMGCWKRLEQQHTKAIRPFADRDQRTFNGMPEMRRGDVRILTLDVGV